MDSNVIVVLSLVQAHLTLACDDGMKTKCIWYTLISRHAKISDMDVLNDVRVRSKLECAEQCGFHRECLTFSVSHDVTGSAVFIAVSMLFYLLHHFSHTAADVDHVQLVSSSGPIARGLLSCS